MKKIITSKLLGLSVIFISVFLINFSFASAEETKKIYFFYGDGCPHCTQVEKFFQAERLYDKYDIDQREIYFNRENAILFNQMLDSLGVSSEMRGVPAVIMGDKILMGDQPIIDGFQISVEEFFGNDSKTQDNLPVVENIQKSDLTLLAVVVGSLVDAINPCEFAVLIILMTTILATGNAKRALLSGLAFSFSMFISYFLMGLGLYKALSLGSLSTGFFQVIGWLAILIGLFNLKDYFWYGKGFLMEVPLTWRPRLKSLIHSVVGPSGAFAIGFLVSLFLLPCTSGPYIVILGMLAKNTLDVQAVLYLLLYNLIFISPMVLISIVVYKGFDPAKAEDLRLKKLRTLHLITGLVMMVMGVVIINGWL
jgi:cytochrome c biogenesis protein CcdA/glutaredoxin